MARSLEHYSDWLDYEGKVYVDPDVGRCKIRIHLFTAVYPYRMEAISVYGDPLNKRNKHYQAVRQQLGDDWSTDILESGPDYQAMVMRTAR
jgi:hypothetical protein